MRQILENPLKIREQIPEDLFIECVDSHGNIRLNKVREHFKKIDRSNIMDLCSLYKQWKNQHECLMLKYIDFRSEKESLVYVKASKRGNDVSAHRQNIKIGFLKNVRKDVQFFTQEEAEKGSALSNLLWVTQTCDSKLGSIHESWVHSGAAFNEYKKRLEKRFGKIRHFYTPEVYPNPEGASFGMVHNHCILVFEDYKFHPEPKLRTVDGKLTLSYRIREIAEFKEAGDWHSFVDVKAIKNANGLYSYCRKHIENTLQGESDQAVLNNAVMWFYRKKSYSMSHGFKNYWNEFITNMQVFRKTKQINFDGEVVSEGKWEFLGVGSMKRLKKDPNIWAGSLDPGAVQDELMLKPTVFSKSDSGWADSITREFAQIILNHRENLINEQISRKF